MIRRHLPDALMVLGIVAVPCGVALIHVAAAIVLGGLELVVLGVVMARRSYGRIG
jgi:hypothetical protein